KPVLGRLFRVGDNMQWGNTGSRGSIVLSYAASQRWFAGDSSVIGRHLVWPKVNWTWTVVGVAPAGLDYPRGAEYWIASEYGSIDVVARLVPGVTPELARQDFLSFLQNDPEQLRV